jgi:CheY-like chemotaxis protein
VTELALRVVADVDPASLREEASALVRRTLGLELSDLLDEEDRAAALATLSPEDRRFLDRVADVLHAAAARAAQAPAAPAAHAANGPRTTILLVDDDTTVRSLVRRILEDAGYTVIEAASGGVALPVLEDTSAHVDLMITDIVMPGMSGAELAVRAGALRPGLPVLLISGFADGAEVAGAAFLAKPFSPAELKRVVAALLSRTAGES